MLAVVSFVPFFGFGLVWFRSCIVLGGMLAKPSRNRKSKKAFKSGCMSVLKHFWGVRGFGKMGHVVAGRQSLWGCMFDKQPGSHKRKDMLELQSHDGHPSRAW